MVILPFLGVSRSLKESHSLFPSWGGLLVNGWCLTFTVCISSLELTWKLTAASQRLRSNPPMCNSPKHWPSLRLPPDLSVLHYLTRTKPTQIATECKEKLLTEIYGFCWITCIIEGYENRLYPWSWRISWRHWPWSSVPTTVGVVCCLEVYH